MPLNDRQRFAVTAVVKRWWARTRKLFRIRKRTSQTEDFQPQVSCNSKLSLRCSDSPHKGIATDVTRPNEGKVHLEEDIVAPKEDILRAEEDLVHNEVLIGGDKEDHVQPEEGAVCSEGDTLRKDMSVFHAGTSEEPEPRICLLDSGAGFNLVSQAALEGIQCDVKPGTREIQGLGSLILPVIGTVKLGFKFWGRDEIFEAEFFVLRSRNVFGHERGPGFDFLLCWNWMKTHPQAWASALSRANAGR
jgi:hypothetical protein